MSVELDTIQILEQGHIFKCFSLHLRGEKNQLIYKACKIFMSIRHRCIIYHFWIYFVSKLKKTPKNIRIEFRNQYAHTISEEKKIKFNVISLFNVFSAKI